VRAWAREMARRHPGVLRIGYFGSYARGDWGVGSDLDIVAVVEHTDRPFHHRTRDWDTESLPVPVDLLVYTAEEWARLTAPGGGMEGPAREMVWVYPPGRRKRTGTSTSAARSIAAEA